MVYENMNKMAVYKPPSSPNLVEQHQDELGTETRDHVITGNYNTRKIGKKYLSGICHKDGWTNLYMIKLDSDC